MYCCISLCIIISRFLTCQAAVLAVLAVRHTPLTACGILINTINNGEIKMPEGDYDYTPLDTLINQRKRHIDAYNSAKDDAFPLRDGENMEDRKKVFMKYRQFLSKEIKYINDAIDKLINT